MGLWLVECCFTSTETVGLLATGAQDGHLDFHTAPELRVGEDERGLFLTVADWRTVWMTRLFFPVFFSRVA